MFIAVALVIWQNGVLIGCTSEDCELHIRDRCEDVPVRSMWCRRGRLKSDGDLQRCAHVCRVASGKVTSQPRHGGRLRMTMIVASLCQRLDELYLRYTELESILMLVSVFMVGGCSKLWQEERVRQACEVHSKWKWQSSLGSLNILLRQELASTS